jgi:NTE family protein
MTPPLAPSIALALSGGGVRAIAFHLGVLRLLAERRLFEHVRRVSTVSGGSLLVGLLLHESGMKWPSSQDFVPTLYGRLRKRLCQRSMQWGAFRQLLKPWNCKFMLSRANLLALALEEEWGINDKLSDIPITPEWSLNGTTAETGKRFRFKRDSLGDYTLGYAAPRDFPLADAMAMSAAFPGGFGPLTLETDAFDWRRRSAWDDPPHTAVPVSPKYPRVRLYDGGVYDNLGLEPVFDSGRGRAKYVDDIILASDASAPLRSGFSFVALNPWRFKRLADIIGDQTRSLRVRTFSHYIQQSRGRGAYFYINAAVSEESPCPSATFAAAFPTTLRRLSEHDFDRLSEHGYKVAARFDAQFGIVPDAQGDLQS